MHHAHRGRAQRRGWPAARLLLVVGFACLTLPSIASASDLYFNELSGSYMLVSDGQTNQFTATLIGSIVTFHDAAPGAVMTPNSDGCSNVDPATISCDYGMTGNPLPIGVELIIDPVDSWDAGPPGCDDTPIDIQTNTGAGPGPATIYGGPGEDSIQASSGSHVYGCGGDDTLSGDAGSTIDGGDGKDQIGTDGYADGGPGDDQLDAGAGATVLGGDGNDNLSDGPGSSTLIGGPGNDDLGSGKGHDNLFGGPGNDVLWAGYKQKHSTIRSGIYAPQAADDLDCGPGHDKAMAGRNSKLKSCERVTRLPRRVNFL